MCIRDREVIAAHLRVNLGDSTTLFCNVTRTNPSISGTFMWVNERTGTQVSEDSNTLVLILSSMEDFATYTCTVANDAGATGSGNVTIKQGCKFIVLLSTQMWHVRSFFTVQPMITTVPPPLPIVVDTTVELVCIVTGVDPPDTITSVSYTHLTLPTIYPV